MTASVETVVIGAGQAGLAMSRWLSDLGCEHVVLERGRVAERWRSERWHTFRLLTPNWQTRLPGRRYQGRDPEGFLRRHEVVAMFDAYARSLAAPVQEGVTVTAVEAAPGGWAVQTTSGRFAARNVVVATGHQAIPRMPGPAAALPPGVAWMHSSRYRSPVQLPGGAVLVVGAGPSGQQIADELARAGRRVLLAAGAHRWLPRRYRDRDTYWWLEQMGLLDRSVDTLPNPAAARRGGAAVLSSRGDLNLHTLAGRGVRPLGRLTTVEGDRVRFGDGLPGTVAAADAHANRFRATVDAFAAAHRLPVPDEQVRTPPAPWADAAPRELSLVREGVAAVIWATGFTSDFSWVHAPVFDADGEPRHYRGVTSAEGLYFLGLRWQHRRKSHFIDGVGEDAAYVATRIALPSTAGWAAATPI